MELFNIIIIYGNLFNMIIYDFILNNDFEIFFNFVVCSLELIVVNVMELIGLGKFNEVYVGVYGYFSVMVCFFGMVVNSVNIVVLICKNMFLLINVFFIWLVVVDFFIMLSYFFFVLYFFIFKELDLFYFMMRYFGWICFLFFYVSFSIVCYIVVIWIIIVFVIF